MGGNKPYSPFAGDSAESRLGEGFPG
jgi:hypothetical protein